MIAQPIIPATKEAKIGKVTVRGQLSKKLGMVWHVPVIPTTLEVSRRITVQTCPNKSHKVLPKK
jgi:hypothetical protein